MISMLLTSALAGITLGIIYGYLFVKRTETTGGKGVKKITNLSLFLSSYALLGFLLYLFIATLKIDLFSSTVFFFLAFWIIVWRYAGKLQ